MSLSQIILDFENEHQKEQTQNVNFESILDSVPKIIKCINKNTLFDIELLDAHKNQFNYCEYLELCFPLMPYNIMLLDIANGNCLEKVNLVILEKTNDNNNSKKKILTITNYKLNGMPKVDIFELNSSLFYSAGYYNKYILNYNNRITGMTSLKINELEPNTSILIFSK